MMQAERAPVRLRFVEGQFISENDLLAERRYRELAMRRHRISGHTWGVVHGLELSVGGNGDAVVAPGLAVDGHGRLLTVDRPTRIDRGLIEGSSPYVWLIARCAGPDDDVSVLRFGVDRPVTPEPPGEPLIGPTGIDDAGTQAWPVVLGRVDSAGPDGTPTGEGRVNAGLVGETVSAPSGDARLVIGSTPDDDRECFSVATVAVPVEDAEDADAEAADRLRQPEPVRRIVVDRSGNTTFRSDTELRRSGEGRPARAVVCPTALLAPADHVGVEFGSVPTPEQERPWTIYRTEVEEGGRPASQLRVEIQPPGDDGDPRPSSLSIGHRRLGRFVSCLSVAADCSVTVRGDIEYHGVLAEGPIQADFNDPRFLAAAANSFVRGAVVGGDGLSGTYATSFEVEATADPTDPHPGDPVDLDVVINNTGEADITILRATVHVSFDGVNQGQFAILLDREVLEAGGDSALGSISFLMPDQENVEVVFAVMASGVGPARIGVYTTTEADATTGGFVS